MLHAPPVDRSSYHRGAAVPPPVTEWLTVSDWYAPKLRYASRYMRRSPSESSFCDVPSCGMHVLPPHACEKAAVASDPPEVSVELLMFPKSTWNFHRLRELLPKFA